MASFEKRGKTWRYSISYVDDEGNRKSSKGGYRTKQEAKRIAEDLEYKMRNGYAISNDVTFADYFYQWYEVNKSLTYRNQPRNIMNLRTSILRPILATSY